MSPPLRFTPLTLTPVPEPIYQELNVSLDQQVFNINTMHGNELLFYLINIKEQYGNTDKNTSILAHKNVRDKCLEMFANITNISDII